MRLICDTISDDFVGVNLYVKNLDDSITDESLREAFKTFGSITSAKVITDLDDKKSVCLFICLYIFILYSQIEKASEGVAEGDIYVIYGVATLVCRVIGDVGSLIGIVCGVVGIVSRVVILVCNMCTY